MKKLGLYIHIPFCQRKCNYCDFLSAPATKQVQNAYMETLQKEIREKATEYREWSVDTVFIGGGTPTSVSYEMLVEMVEIVKAEFCLENGCEITMECNPGTVTLEALKAYRSAGINRLSIGLQSTEDELLKKLGRIHTYEQFLETYRWAREACFDNINVDIMSALPEQSLKQYEDTLEKIAMLGVEHISAYSLIVEEGTPFYEWFEKDMLLLPDEEEERQMYYKTKEVLAKAGYTRYEISNYAKEGYECRHNIRYWVRKPYLGLGLGASSFVSKERYKNVSVLEAYMSGDGYMKKEEAEKLSEREEMEEFMFLGLRLTKGIKKFKFEKEFGRSIAEVYGAVIDRLKGERLIEEDEESIWLTEYGVDVSNVVLSEFLLDN